MIATGRYIVKEETVDDGTTCGQTVYTDNYGKQWVATMSTKETCGTGETIGELVNGQIFT